MSETPKASGSQETNQQALVVDNDVRPHTATPSTLSEQDYEAIAAAVMETERGRWFLDEYARRNRHSDTQTVLTALERLEEKIGQAKPAAAPDDTSVALISHNVIDLAEAITQVKREVQELGGKGAQSDHFNTATEELEAIVAQTETATGEILEAAEKVQEVLWVLREGGANETQCDIIESKIIDIYTACSFQDLTGQRSNKVVRLVSYVEKRVSTMMGILGLSAPAAPDSGASASSDDDRTPIAAYQEDDDRNDAHLLNGPAKEGEGNEQGDVDALFASTAHSLGEDNDSLEESADMVLEAERQAAAVMEGLAQSEDDAPSADIFTNDTVIEIADAEIWLDPDEQAVAMASLASTHTNTHDGDDQAADVFEVEPLEFDGPDMAEQLARSRARREGLANPENGVLADLPDTFALDDPSSDMFESAPLDSALDEQTAPGDDATLTSNAVADAQVIPSAMGQDIFEVELVGESHSDAFEADPSDEIALDTAMTTQADAADAADVEMPADSTPAQESDRENAVTVQQPAEPATEQLARHAQASNPPATPYTDEERIALFS